MFIPLYITLIGEKETEKGKQIGITRPLWNSEKFYSNEVTRDKKGKKMGSETPKKFLVMVQPETHRIKTQIRDTNFIELYTPTPETKKETTIRNKLLSDLLAEKSELETPYLPEEILKFSYAEYTIKTRGYKKSVVIAKRHAEVIIRGKVKFRKIKRVDSIPPDYKTFKVLKGFEYRFYFHNIATGQTVTRDIKTNNTRARKHPTRTIKRNLHFRNKITDTQDALNLLYGKGNGINTPTPTRYIEEKIYLPLIKIVQLKPIKSVIYPKNEILKPEHIIKSVESKYDFDPTRTHASNEISIDYKQLARAQIRISKKWFKLLTESLKDDTLVYELPKHLKKLRTKIVKSKSVTPRPLKKQKPITSRRDTVTEFNYRLTLDAEIKRMEMLLRKNVDLTRLKRVQKKTRARAQKKIKVKN